MRTLATLLMVAALAACSPEQDRAPPASGVTTTSQEGTARPIFPAPETIVGEYRVAGIDGKEINANFGIALSIAQDRIAFEPTCAGFVWTYDYEPGGSLSTERHPEYGGQVGPDGSVVMCAVGILPEYRALAQALDAATRVGRTPTNALDLSGGERSVTLFSQ